MAADGAHTAPRAAEGGNPEEREVREIWVPSVENGG
jgi:hypothetical protein